MPADAVVANAGPRMLIDHLDPDQSDRYAKYRAVKLKKEIVRRVQLFPFRLKSVN